MSSEEDGEAQPKGLQYAEAEEERWDDNRAEIIDNQVANIDNTQQLYELLREACRGTYTDFAHTLLEGDTCPHCDHPCVGVTPLELSGRTVLVITTHEYHHLHIPCWLCGACGQKFYTTAGRLGCFPAQPIQAVNLAEAPTHGNYHAVWFDLRVMELFAAFQRFNQVCIMQIYLPCYFLEEYAAT